MATGPTTYLPCVHRGINHSPCPQCFPQSTLSTIDKLRTPQEWRQEFSLIMPANDYESALLKFITDIQSNALRAREDRIKKLREALAEILKMGWVEHPEWKSGSMVRFTFRAHEETFVRWQALLKETA